MDARWRESVPGPVTGWASPAFRRMLGETNAEVFAANSDGAPCGVMVADGPNVRLVVDTGVAACTGQPALLSGCACLKGMEVGSKVTALT